MVCVNYISGCVVRPRQLDNTVNAVQWKTDNRTYFEVTAVTPMNTHIIIKWITIELVVTIMCLNLISTLL